MGRTHIDANMVVYLDIEVPVSDSGNHRESIQSGRREMPIQLCFAPIGIG